MRLVVLALAGVTGCSFSVPAASGDGAGLIDARPPRIARSPIVLYTFEENSGSTVVDRSGAGTPLDLVIPDPARVVWGAGTLTVTMATLIASPGAATKVLDACREADGVTLEAWLTPAAIGTGLARVVTVSSNSSDLALTLMSQDAHFEFRMRGPMTDANGLPSLNSPAGSLTLAPLHVVLVSEPAGPRRIYIDGVETSSDLRGGDLASWGTAHRFGLANEISGGRPWLGTFDLVAIYAAPLTPGEIAINFAAGPR